MEASEQKKQLMLGNAAVARGLYEAGCRFVSSYPGTPSTEITEEAALYDEIYAEWAPNEKVALEAAFGASLAGVRSFSGMKHVGLNVAADPLFTMAYTGVRAGLVIGVADDPGMHSSQNEQDSRHYAAAAKLPMLEPADSAECKAYTKLAFTLSETFDTPVLLRLTTRISHARSAVALSERTETDVLPYAKDPQKYVMMPANARGRHIAVEKRMEALAAWAETTDINQVIPGKENPGQKRIGVLAAGIAFQTAREALGDTVSYCKLGMVYPLPVERIRSFAASVDELIVIEELDDVLETAVRKLGIPCRGKSLFSLIGEYSAEAVAAALAGRETTGYAPPLVPNRPPVLCPGCPHRGVFYVLSKMQLFVSGDIGCYTLGALPPLGTLDTTLCMGASVSGLHGYLKAGGQAFARRSVAVIGDSTFMHSGVTGLINIVYNQSPATVLILDNSITGMTGHQQNPCTGLTLKNTPAPAVDLAALCAAVGVRRVRTEDPFDLSGLETALREELAADEPSVILVQRPCALLKHVQSSPPFVVDGVRCKKCKKCMQIGCPAISFDKETGARINAALCVGCGLCGTLCPFGAMQPQERTGAAE